MSDDMTKLTDADLDALRQRAEAEARRREQAKITAAIDEANRAIEAINRRAEALGCEYRATLAHLHAETGLWPSWGGDNVDDEITFPLTYLNETDMQDGPMEVGYAAVTVRGSSNEVVTIAQLGTAVRYLRWHCEDGTYTLAGGDWEAVVERRDGLLHPVGGDLSRLKALLPEIDTRAN